MQTDEVIALIAALAWPFVAVIAIIYVWKSDAVGKLIEISKAIDDLKSKLSDLVQAEERLSRSVQGFGEITSAIEAFQNSIISIQNDIQNIRDRVESKPDIPAATSKNLGAKTNPQTITRFYRDMELAWNSLVDSMRSKFGWVDGRMVGSEAYRLAHGNRKGPKLTYEQAEEIGRLHSDIKSFKRRQSTVLDWLTPDIGEDFCKRANSIRAAVDSI